MARRKITAEDFDEKRMSKNPFAADLVIPVTVWGATKNLIEPGMTGDTITSVEGSYTVKRKYPMERTEYMKMYKVPAQRKHLAAMPPRALHLLRWIEYTAKAGSDYIVINIARYKAESGSSHSTYSRAVEDLVKGEVIGMTIWPNVFWINPRYCFAGDRLAKYPDKLLSIKDELA